MMRDRWFGGGFLILAVFWLAGCVADAPPAERSELPDRDPAVLLLSEEVRGQGWIVFSARSDQSDWELYLMRPDGSQRRNITQTPAFHEMGGRFSPDGKKLLYRRLDRGSKFHHLNWGLQGQLMIASSDGSDPVAWGGEGEYPWASWGPDGKQVACLYKSGIKIFDLSSREMVRELDRQGIYQQLFWSPNGEDFCGPANQQGRGWGVVRLNMATGEVNSMSRPEAACTGDWFPDSQQAIYSYRPAGQEILDGGQLARLAGQKLEHGWTQLWMSDKQGSHHQLLYGEDGRHIYGGAVSPDGKYVLLTRSRGEDLKVLGSEIDTQGVWRSGAPMALMRLSDAPVIRGESLALRKLHPDAKAGPVLELPEGWEPYWTHAEIRLKP